MKKNEIIKYSLILSVLFILLAIVVFDQESLWFLGTAISVIGCVILYLINHK